MARAYNFSPGPAMLPDEVMREVQAEFCEFRDWRASVMEVSHRGAGFLDVYRETESLLRELIDVGDEYAVLFLPGGATGQTAAVPLNLTAAGEGAAYLISGRWSSRAADEARRFCRVHVVGDSGEGYTTLPAMAPPPDDVVYLHIAENETVHGVEYPRLPETTLPIVADLTSNIATREIEVRDYGLIYASAQKNLGIAGIAIVIVRRDLVRPREMTPSVLDYGKQAAIQSMYNTPPTFPLYLVGRVLDWTRRQGGVAAMAAAAAERAALLYECLDESGFYRTPVAVDAGCRSRVNVPFFLADERLTADFLAGAEARGLLGLKGHKALGGVRASMYNSMPLAGVRALVEYLREFEKTRG